MIGSNSMSFNKASMMEALQHYFDTVLFADGKAPKVTDVKYCSNGPYDRRDQFEITTSQDNKE